MFFYLESLQYVLWFIGITGIRPSKILLKKHMFSLFNNSNFISQKFWNYKFCYEQSSPPKNKQLNRICELWETSFSRLFQKQKNRKKNLLSEKFDKGRFFAFFGLVSSSLIFIFYGLELYIRVLPFSFFRPYLGRKHL